MLPGWAGLQGFGQRALESLLGHVGTMDVTDCMVRVTCECDQWGTSAIPC